MDTLFSDALRDLLADQCTPQVVRAIESQPNERPLWDALESSGFADAMLSESLGGAGLGLSEAFHLLAMCGAHSVPVPLGETMWARALLGQHQVAVPTGSITWAIAQSRAKGELHADTVRMGRVADHAIVTDGTQAWLLPTATAAQNAAGFPLDATLTWTGAAVAQAQALPFVPDVRTLQACLYAAQLSGALMTVFERTLQYANDRQQFGRPIGKFQAIQHHLSVMSEHAFAARMAAQLGCQSDTMSPDRLRVAVAKARTSEAALEVAALGHSIHGAIGFTAEFDLQLLTRRLHVWRQAAGSESYWHTVLGQALMDRPQAQALDLIREVSDVH